jgi:glycosyltransferase involved in cell wall biosynthesis
MTADTVGGVWTYALDLARALGEEGVEVALACMGGYATREQRSEARAVETLELFESSFRLPWMEQPWSDVQKAGEWLLDLASRLSPGLVHLNEPVHGSLAWPVPVLAVAHSCVLSWWESVERRAPPADWDQYRDEMGRGLRGADQVVAPSKWMLEAVQRFYGVKGGRVIPNGRDASERSPSAKEPLIFAAGRLWDPAKNLLALEEVAEELPWPVFIAGEPQHPNGHNQVTAEHIQLLGRVPADEVAAWLRRASIYAFPALYEPFGLSVLEAAQAGCALVLGDIPTLRELWDGAAIFVSPDQPSTLRLALEGLIEDAPLRQALAMRAHRRALSFTPGRMAHAYIQVYTDLLAGRGSYAEETACAL